MADMNSIKQRSKELVRGEVLYEWDQAKWVEAEYEYYKAEQPEVLKDLGLQDIEQFENWVLDGWENDELVELWSAFVGLFTIHSYYAEVYSVCGWRYDYNYDYIKGVDVLWRLLGIEGYQKFKITKLTDQGFPALEVEWHDIHAGHNGRAIVTARQDSICPACETEYAHDYEEGEKERAFIRRWGRCPYCVEDAIVNFCQGDRTDDTAFLTQPGDYLMWERIGAIRDDMASVGYYLDGETLGLLWDVKRPVPGDPEHFMYGR